VALVVFIRGINVGGHRRFRPSLLSQDPDLQRYDVVNIGAAGTLVVRRRVPTAELRLELLSRMPFEAEIAICEGSALLALERENPFAAEPPAEDTVQFISVLTRSARATPTFPISVPPSGAWFVRILGIRKRFVFGVYRRHMKTIGYLGELDKLFGVPAITRNWNTIAAIARVLKS
jgi:uncharacterized protein (DUF1697 family)